ncbi:UDP-N-acetylglucosamine transferase subunit ALG14 homolog [Venturia canescens]|uniref:UDP-N-acetylglucosamine transferase subunit ALG14 homolog n=1 Tax=Venturia canescens TaxID=32260 RepID=UPI001C9D3BB7|nr:UDP-N-acetylglucosamine transferase subunit ALG14 homolog [Venturia canescens]
MFWTIIYAIVLSVVLLLGRILYVVQNKNGEKKKGNSKYVKTLVILGSGGHTTEILEIVKNLNFERYRPRIYVYASSDNISSSKINELETNTKDFETIKISRSREVGQSYVTSVWTTIISFKDSVQVVWRVKPDLILCNGPGTCVPICVAAFLMKLMFLCSTTIIFVESFCRVKTYSLSGKILCYIANHVIVQWPQLCKSTKNHIHLIK